ncbi:uncharacterized protein LOC129773897 [Toxorhynchites rutilus septentrionalis]|uniref:uncharacterized protein LOC129773897 n=1 Tax=Toxorhynchites rutilus septentrionalis TaxID=329112 RepID=UPI002479FA22|nr:uncharacterized protein LOC129773897 [Toxorhynchites rutilus septentrionalis]
MEFIDSAIDKIASLNVLKRNLQCPVQKLALPRDYFFQQNDDPKQTDLIMRSKKGVRLLVVQTVFSKWYADCPVVNVLDSDQESLLLVLYAVLCLPGLFGRRNRSRPPHKSDRSASHVQRLESIIYCFRDELGCKLVNPFAIQDRFGTFGTTRGEYFSNEAGTPHLVLRENNLLTGLLPILFGIFRQWSTWIRRFRAQMRYRKEVLASGSVRKGSKTTLVCCSPLPTLRARNPYVRQLLRIP